MKIQVSKALAALRAELAGAASAEAVATAFMEEAERIAGCIRTSGGAITRWLASAPAAPDGLFVDLDGRRQTQAHGLLKAAADGLLGEAWTAWAATEESEDWESPEEHEYASRYWFERAEQIRKMDRHVLQVWIDEADRFPVVAEPEQSPVVAAA